MISALIQATFWCGVLLLAVGVRKVVLSGRVRAALRSRYTWPGEAERVERTLSFGLSLILVIVALFIVGPLLFG